MDSNGIGSMGRRSRLWAFHAGAPQIDRGWYIQAKVRDSGHGTEQKRKQRYNRSTSSEEVFRLSSIGTDPNLGMRKSPDQRLDQYL